jgi:hypothetical protein
LPEAETPGFASRARAGALAEPEDAAAENPVLDGPAGTGGLSVISGDGAETTGAGVGWVVSKGEESRSRSKLLGSGDFAVSAMPLEAEAAKLVCGVCFCAGMIGDEIGEFGAAAPAGAAG